MLKDLWQGLGRASRIGFVAGCAVIIAVTIALAVWLLRTDYEVLFANLKAQDAAAMTAELDRMKLPYKLGTDGTSILVDKATVHQTRLKLMGKDIPLHGAVGFELFNNTDFGMTEFAQKINYQRALQGEITRTILSLSEVESVRVHLAFPEEGLFKREQGKAKASVTLALKHGQTLRSEQVAGIQRLVAAAVTGISPQDVTIVNQHGVALTRSTLAEGHIEQSPRLELKREIEQQLARKASDVLDRTFGAGRALASVDVTLNMDQVRVTKEDVTSPAARPGDTPTGVIVRERETVKDDGTRDGAATAGSSQRETEYQVGRRVEQVVSQPGSIQRLQVLAVIKTPIDSARLEQVKALIGAAVGASIERGDTVVVQSLDHLVGPATPTSGDLPAASAVGVPPSGGAIQTDIAATTGKVGNAGVVMALAGVLLGVAAAALLWMFRHMLARRSIAAPALTPLTSQQRQVALGQLQRWLADERGLPAAAKGVPGGR